MKRQDYALASLILLLVVGLGVVALRPVKNVRADSTGLVELGSAWNVSSVASGGVAFVTSLKTSQSSSIVRVGVVLGSSVPLSIIESDGTNTFTSLLNGGTALTAGCCYTFTWVARNKSAIGGKSPGPTVFNFVVQGPTTIPILRCDEVVGGAD